MSRAPALLALVCAACGLLHDYDALENGASLDAGSAATTPDAGRPADRAASVVCGAARCANGDVCCLDADGRGACSSADACTGTPMPCDGSEDCAPGLVCCGQGSLGGTGGNVLDVACRTSADCGRESGARILCDPAATPPCVPNDRCIATETIPGRSKCSAASDAL